MSCRRLRPSHRLRPSLYLSLIMAGLSGCAVAPTVHYYTLLAPAQAAEASGPGEGDGVKESKRPFLIDLQAVGVPLQFEQPQFVVRHGESAVLVLENERWISPMADEMRAALSGSLSRRLGMRDVAGLARPAGAPVFKIQVQVRRLDAWPGQRVEFEADWSLTLPSSKTEVEHERKVYSSRLTEAAPGGYADLVSAQQRVIESLAGSIANEVREWLASRTPPGAAHLKKQ